MKNIFIKKASRNFFAGALLSFVCGTGCATRTQILSTPLVSMTETGTAPGTKLTPAGKVSSSFCIGDKVMSTNTMNVGLLDEVIFRAQQESKARYITDMQFYIKQSFFSNPCYELEGTAMK